MKRKWYTEPQIVFALQQADRRTTVGLPRLLTLRNEGVQHR